MDIEVFRRANSEIRSYAHFDNRVSLKNDAVWKYVTNPSKIVKHKFYPFISFKKDYSKYSHRNKIKKPKKRPLCYSSHIDRCIYQYYAYLINEKYNERAIVDGINECAVAYRNNLHKNNVDFAHDAYDFIRQNNDCYVMVGDFKGFFDCLDHGYLKKKLCDLLDCERMSDDYYAVFKSITKYSSCKYDDILAFLGMRNNRKTIKKLNSKERIMSIEQFHSFKKMLVEDDGQRYAVCRNKDDGIPQGSAISAVLANVYMLSFDYEIKSYIDRFGGLYMRYSDDFIVIIPNSSEDKFRQQKSDIDRMIAKIPNLIIESDKTQIFSFFNGSLENVSRNFAVGGEELNKTLDYLGFSFDGRKVRIRDKTITKYYYRMYRKVNTVECWLEKYNRMETNSLYELYSNSISKKKPSDNKTIEERRKSKGKSNFLTYIKRVKKVMGEDNYCDTCERSHLVKIRRRLDMLTKVRRGGSDSRKN